MSSSSSTSTSLLIGLRAQNPEVWVRFASIYSPIVYKWCRQLGLKESEAPDVVQEVFLAVHRSISTFEKQEKNNSFTRWLYRVTQNKSIDCFRKRDNQVQAVGGTTLNNILHQTEELVDEESYIETAESEIVRRAAEHVKNHVGERTWLMFHEAAIQEIEVKVVAKKYEVKPCTVYQARFRVLRRIKVELEGLLELVE